MQPKSKYSKKIFAATITSLLLLAVVPAMSNASAVTTLELCLAVDRSGSIEDPNLGGAPGNMNIILLGIQSGLMDAAVQQALVDRMAILSLVSFATGVSLDIAPTTMTSLQDVSDFADTVAALGLTSSGLTNTGGAIDLCEAQFTDASIGTINIITDGVPTTGPDAQTEANNANALGILINALGIGDQIALMFLDDLVDGPPAGMVFITQDVMGFEEAFMEKISMEVMMMEIGGEILSLNASALLVSGFMMNAIWILPTIAATGIAGTGLYLLRSRLNKTSEE